MLLGAASHEVCEISVVRAHNRRAMQLYARFVPFAVIAAFALPALPPYPPGW